MFQKLAGQLTLNQTCWAGIGFSPDQSMQNATVFLIGTFSNDKPLVATYSASTAPLGHAPPVVRGDPLFLLCPLVVLS